MAEATTDPTIDDGASKASSGWVLIVEDLFPQWRDRLGSSKDAGHKLVDLLCDPETRSKIYRVNASREIDPNTVCFPDIEFWPGLLVLVPDADGGDDHLVANYRGDPYLDFYDPDGHWEFYVRRIDVERWERKYPELAAPPPPRPPTKTPKPAGSAKPAREPSFEQAARDAAIQHRLNNGVVPGSTVQWDRFCHRVRADCGVYTDDPKKIPRGLTDDRITRITRMLMKRQA
jgi:hypothetical protein